MSTVAGNRPSEWEFARRSGRWSSGFWQLLPILRPHYWLMGITVLTGILNQGFLIAAAGIGAFMVGRVATGAEVEDLYFSAIVLGIVVAGRAVAAWSEMWLAHDLAYRVLAEFRNWLYQALDRLAPGYLLERRSADLSTAAMADVETFEWFYAHTVGDVHRGSRGAAGGIIHPSLLCIGYSPSRCSPRPLQWRPCPSGCASGRQPRDGRCERTWVR